MWSAQLCGEIIWKIGLYFNMDFFLVLSAVKPQFVSLGVFIVKCDHSNIRYRLIEQYFPVVLFIMLNNMILTFESVDEILKCDHSNESY